MTDKERDWIEKCLLFTFVRVTSAGFLEPRLVDSATVKHTNKTEIKTLLGLRKPSKPNDLYVLIRNVYQKDIKNLNIHEKSSRHTKSVLTSQQVVRDPIF